MSQRASWLIFNSLLNRTGSRSDYLPFLSSEDKEKILTLPPTKEDVSAGIPTYMQQLEPIHYSWLAKLLEGFNENDQLFFLFSLDSAKALALKKNLGIKEEDISPTPSASLFLQKKLLDWLTEGVEDFLPAFLLPKDPLNILLETDKRGLVALIDKLGLYDLAKEMKKLIDSAKLRRILEILPSEMLAHLKRISQEKDRLQTPPLHLDKWDGQKERLLNLIHTRGLNRLGKALYFSDKNLLWHVMHRLDMVRAHALERHCTASHDPAVKQILVQQIENLKAYRI